MSDKKKNFSEQKILNRKKEKNPFKRAAVLALGMAFSACLLAAALVVYVDPFFHYHSPLKGFPYLVDNQLSQNPGMAAHMEYDSVILGSSMTVNFQTSWFKELMGLNAIKLSYSGAFPKDQANIMDIIFERDPGSSKKEKKKVKKVFLGVDVITYTGGVDETKYPVPEYLYDDNYLNDIKYLLNKDVILNYILRPMADPDPTDLSNVYASWWTEEYYSEQWVLHNYTSPEQVVEETARGAYLASVEKNLAVNICPYIEQNPETEFIVFFPPYSILFWNDVLKENHLEATMEEYRYITERLNAYENVKVYFFPDREEIICDLNHYADYSHYHPRYNRYMAECFASGECLVAREGEKGKGIEEYLLHMREIVENFDFEELLLRK
ncbi:hypothetical protein [Parablautia intestinalis]|uniref:hypothetical protein n=1 Tax=Parablautia intestinalis TaxID=2320100 RepID=UPI0023C7283E|nr:hypothetical protein [Parablautia intestinalis]MDE7048108.1 hypothetical protein [Lachnospiraceae bacterium]